MARHHPPGHARCPIPDDTWTPVALRFPWHCRPRVTFWMGARMPVRPHGEATATPKIRAAIQASDEPAWVPADRYGITGRTVCRWRHRDGVEDGSHTPHRPRTAPTPAREAVAVVPRRTPPPPLDGLPAAVREFLNPKVSRPGPGRRLRRHGVGSPRGMKAQAPRPGHGAFGAYGPGYIHIDVKYLPRMKDGTARRHPLVAIDRAARWVSVRVFPAKSAANTRRFPRDPERACPLRFRTVPTDSGKGFTDRPSGLRERAATGKHGFGQLRAGPDTGHRPTPPRSPRTDGMAGRFNGRVEDVLRGHRFQSGEDPGRTLPRCVRLHNQRPPRSVPGSETPLRAMKHWHKPKPEPFRKNPYQLAGCDTVRKSSPRTALHVRHRHPLHQRSGGRLGWLGANGPPDPPTRRECQLATKNQCRSSIEIMEPETDMPTGNGVSPKRY